MGGTSPSPDPLQLARLAVLRRLGMGTAHAMNNALTAAMGEASFLLEDHKEDPGVAEACRLILASLDRCARLSHAWLRRSHPGQQGDGEVDLVRLVRDLERWLDEAIGSRRALTVEAPDDLVLVTGDTGELELLVMALVAFGADQDLGAELVLRVDGGTPASLVVEGRAGAAAQGAAEILAEPARSKDPIVACTLVAVQEKVRELGGSFAAEAVDPDRWRATIRLPRLA